MKNIESAAKVLSDYFSTFIPEDQLILIVKSCKYVQSEVKRDSIQDTFARGLLISAVTKYIKCSAWPSYGESSRNSAFVVEYEQKLKSIGGYIIN
jgi:hypothetical protein